jgi:glutaminyl-peptide cyclotransferase
MLSLLLCLLFTLQANVELKGIYPRKTHYFTQGFSYLNSTTVLESSGLFTDSHIQILNATNFKTLKSYAIEPKYFGEGSTLLGDTIYMLTWTNGVYFTFDLNLENQQTFVMPSEIVEGWGLTSDASNLYASDGTSYIYKLDTNMSVVSKFKVAKGKQEFNNLNELEYNDNHIYANIYLTPFIVKFDLEGEVEEVYDFQFIIDLELQTKMLDSNDVLNGIAYNKQNNTFMITGKRWSHIYEVALN